MDHEREIARLVTLEYGEPLEVVFRFGAISVGGVILFLYTGWVMSFVWLGLYFAAHLVNYRFLRSRGPEYTASDTVIAGVLFLVILACFLWIPGYLMLQRDLALQISGAAALASVLIFLVRRSDTLRFMVYGQIAIVAAAVALALAFTLPRIEFVLARVALTFCAVGMIGYLAHAILASRKARLESEETERRLRHTQKLEALGQLTGGVAHDFNNLLAVIQGNAEMLHSQVGEDSPLVGAILRATDRGSDLTRRLLAFSRRQPLRPVVVDLARVAPDTIALLKRVLPETILLKVDWQDDLWPVLVDRGQFENALVNLALNSRDAMPETGNLTIAFSNLTVHRQELLPEDVVGQGDWVVVAVTDTGSGMVETTRKRAVEPFFTTKPVGEGHGLGLSMVHGFVHQSGGVVDIRSAPGRGTTVKLYLPRAQAPEVARPAQPQAGVPRGEGQSILVVEDEAEVRRFLKLSLIELGYTVHTAGDAASARAVAGKLEAIDLLLSDIVLPGGVNGYETARELFSLHPGMRLLFVSGHPADAVPGDLGIDRDFGVLHKPFRLAELGRAVAEALRA